MTFFFIFPLGSPSFITFSIIFVSFAHWFIKRLIESFFHSRPPSLSISLNNQKKMHDLPTWSEKSQTKSFITCDLTDRLNDQWIADSHDISSLSRVWAISCAERMRNTFHLLYKHQNAKQEQRKTVFISFLSLLHLFSFFFSFFLFSSPLFFHSFINSFLLSFFFLFFLF